MAIDILYIDDEVDNLAVFKATFEDDFEILCVPSGQEALAVLEKTTVPVVVADQRMPGITGVELFEILHKTYPHTKRIVLTGYIDANAMLDAINRGQVYHFLTKPWQRETLMAVLIRALEAYRLEVAHSALTTQLVSSQRLAMLGKATARIAHEMSNQLCVLPILEHLETHFGGDKELQKFVSVLRNMSGRLSDLLDEIRALVRGEHQEMVMVRLSLANAVRELVAFMRFDKDLDSSNLVLEIAHDPAVCGNKLKIQQVLANLIKNAAHAIRERQDGRIRVTVTGNENDALLVVEDNGCGIPLELQSRIWEPCFSTKGEEGNGFGLDICRELVHSHGGDIWVESQVGKGSRFHVRLPAAAPAGGSVPTTAKDPLTLVSR